MTLFVVHGIDKFVSVSFTNSIKKVHYIMKIETE